MIKRAFLSFLLAVGLVVGSVTALPASAAADLKIDGVSVVVEPIKSAGMSKVSIVVNFGGPSGYTLDDPYVTLQSDVGLDFHMVELEPTSRYDRWTATYYIPNYSQPGRWWLGVDAVADWASGDWDYYSNDFVKPFNVQRPSRLTLNATPEPVSKRTPVTVTGRLTLLRFKYESIGYGPYWSNLSGQRVNLYFDPAGSEGRRLVTTVVTNSQGVYVFKWNATRTGTWSAEYAGTSSRTFARSAGDSITVR